MCDAWYVNVLCGLFLYLAYRCITSNRIYDKLDVMPIRPSRKPSWEIVTQGTRILFQVQFTDHSERSYWSGMFLLSQHVQCPLRHKWRWTSQLHHFQEHQERCPCFCSIFRNLSSFNFLITQFPPKRPRH